MFDLVGLGFEPNCLTYFLSYNQQKGENPEVLLPILSTITLLVCSTKALPKKKASKHLMPTNNAGASS